MKQSERGKLLANTSLCRPILEYGDTLWEHFENTTSDAIEHELFPAERFIKNIKGRHVVGEGRAKLELKPQIINITQQNIIQHNTT